MYALSRKQASSIGFAILALGFALLSCSPEVSETEAWQVAVSGSVDDLESLGRLSSTEVFRIGDVVAVGPCEILLLGSVWGGVVQIDLSAEVARWVGRVPIVAGGYRLSGGIGGTVFLSTSSPPWGATLSQDRFVKPLELPVHPWWETVGGVVKYGGPERYLISFFEEDYLIAAPGPYARAPLALVVGDDSEPHVLVGTTPGVADVHLAAPLAKTRLFLFNDTVTAVFLYSGRLLRFDLHADSSPYQAREVLDQLLPSLFSAVEPMAEVWSAEWIQHGGDFSLVKITPQLADAALTTEGTLWVLRNTGFRWSAIRSPDAKAMFESPGEWIPTSRVVEAHDPHLGLLGRWTTPMGLPERMTVDHFGRLYLWFDHGIEVFRDPFSSVPEPTCGMPSDISELLRGVPDLPSSSVLQNRTGAE